MLRPLATAARIVPLFASIVALAPVAARAGSPPELAGLDAAYPALDALYQDLHRSPELSNQEEKTAAKMAVRLREVGFEVTERVGGHGVVGVLRNGAGPTVLVRTDMDALPVKEQTGLPYASTVTAKNDAGQVVPVMHACGHDIHMASWIGAAKLLSAGKERWRGTLVFVGQPAEEIGAGAKAMVKDGLGTRFPKPDFVIAVHDTPLLPSGQVGLVPGYAYANLNSVDITFHGKGGHGAYPHRTVDPVLMAARAVVTLQSIVAREIDPLDPAVVTVGTFHAGTKRNIIPDDARIELTVRSYKPEVRKHLLSAIARIAKAEAAAAGAPREPTILVTDESADAVYNDPVLSERLATGLRRALGSGNVVSGQRVMGAEDFGVFGKEAGVPSVMMGLGAAEPEEFAKAKAADTMLPGLHSALFAPDRERTIRTGVAAFTISVLELLGRPAGSL